MRRPVGHSILATCFLTTAWAATAICEPVSLWTSNGSVMSMEVVGGEHVFRYQEPRIGMRQAGVVSGTLRFKGTRSGDAYTGTAFVFSRRCGAHPFRVTGTISEDKREIEAFGSAPGGFDAACRPLAFHTDGVRLSFLRLVGSSPLPSLMVERKESPAESAAEAARAEETGAVQEREEHRLRSLREQEAAQARIAQEQPEAADRVSRELEQEESGLVEARDFANQREACRKYVAEACDIALKFTHASEQEVADLRNWRGVAEKFAADRDRCRAGAVAACDRALASPAAGAEQRPLLNEWRNIAAPFNRAIAVLSSYAGTAAAATVNAAGAVRNLPTIIAGLAAILALTLVGMALRMQNAKSGTQSATPSAFGTANPPISEAKLPVGWRQFLSGRLARWMAIMSHRAPPVAHDAPDAIGALRLAHALIENVREAATPAREEHVGRKRQLDLLALAAKQLAIAHKRDPDAILEGQDESGQLYRFSIDELKAAALLLEGITQHAYDGKRAVRALRKATTLNTNSAYAFYVLGVMHATSMNRAQAVAALRRAVALKPQNVTYREELDRARGLSAGIIARIFDSGLDGHGSLAMRNIARSLRRAHFSLYRGAMRLQLPRFH